MKYYIGNLSFDSNYLEHYGVKGMKWGKHRRKQDLGYKIGRGIAKAESKIRNWYTGNNHLTSAGQYTESASLYKDIKDEKTKRYFEERPDLVDIDKSYKKGSAPWNLAKMQATDGLARYTERETREYNYNQKKAQEARKKYSNAPKQVIARAKSKGKAFIDKLLTKKVTYNFNGTKVQLNVSPSGKVTDGRKKR